MMGIRLASVCLLVLLAACSRDVVPPLRPVDDSLVTILEPAAPDVAMRRWLNSLREQWPAARWVPPDQWEAAMAAALEAGHTVLIPDSARVPVESLAWIEAYLSAGGKALFLGAAPFADVMVRFEAEQLSHSDYRTRLMARAEAVEDFSAIQLWSHAKSGGDQRSVVRAARAGDWQAVQVEPHALYQWDHMALPTPISVLETSDYGAVAFSVRGSRYTSRLVLRARDQAGTEWLRPLAVGPEWEPQIVLNKDWFVLERRGGESETPPSFDWAHVVDLSVGLDMSLVPQSAGRHEYSVSDMRLVPCRTLLPPVPRMQMPWIQDPAWRDRMDVLEVRGVRTDARWRLRGKSVGIPWQNPAVRTPTDAARWIPLATASDRTGDSTGSVAGLFLRHRDGEPLEQWAWIGLDVTRRTQSAVQSLVNECLFFMQRGRFLMQAEMSAPIFFPGESFEIEAQVAGLNSDPLTVRVSAELIDEAGQIIRRVVSSPFELFGGMIEPNILLHLGVVPQVEQRVQAYTIQAGLEEVGGQSRRFDRMQRFVKVTGVQKHPDAGDRVRTLAGRIVAGRIPLFFMGIEYDPGLLRHPDPVWLQARHFPAGQILSDLADIRAAGANAISVPYSAIDQARQIRYVMEAARLQSLRVLLRLPNAWYWSLEADELQPYLDAIGFAEDTNVFALDLTPPALQGAEAEWGNRLNAAWTHWLQHQAGDLASAVEYWGDHVRFDEQERALFPMPEELRELPEESPLWALRQRFLADWWSAELGRIARQVRGAGYRTLLTAQWNAADADFGEREQRIAPFPAQAGAIHLDVLTVVPGRLVGGAQYLGGEAFKAAYARGNMYGKPVMWGPFSTPVGEAPYATDWALQADMVTALYRLAMGTQSSGGWLEHYRPIATVPWDVDAGVVDSSGRRRPAIRALRQAVNQLRAYRMPPLQWAGREMAWHDGARPWAAASADWGRVYAQELTDRRVIEIRPRGYNVWSADASADRLANVPDAPFVQMHAEWGAIRIADQEVESTLGTTINMQPRQILQAEWINRGPARWTASQHQQEGSVWMTVRRVGGITQDLEVRTVPPGGRVMIEWRPVDPGTYILRGQWLDRGGFGDALVVKVEE